MQKNINKTGVTRLVQLMDKRYAKQVASTEEDYEELAKLVTDITNAGEEIPQRLITGVSYPVGINPWYQRVSDFYIRGTWNTDKYILPVWCGEDVARATEYMLEKNRLRMAE